MSMIEELRLAYAQFRLRYPVYVFHHIPKCGGTSVRAALDEWFAVNDDYTPPSLVEPQPPITLKSLSRNNCIAGHFGHEGHYLDQRYPALFAGFRAKHRYRVFSFLREPLQMRCSLYRHELKQGVAQAPDLASAIMTFPNYYSRILHVTEDTWRERLNAYFFIGDVDDLQDSFNVLAKLINKPEVMLPSVNTTVANRDDSLSALSQEQIEAFKAANALDYEIYRWARERLHRAL